MDLIEILLVFGQTCIIEKRTVTQIKRGEFRSYRYQQLTKKDRFFLSSPSPCHEEQDIGKTDVIYKGVCHRTPDRHPGPLTPLLDSSRVVGVDGRPAPLYSVRNTMGALPDYWCTSPSVTLDYLFRNF